ncbi:hypothetical protein ACOME3_008308 [Neoechinorhynchus agilis]
MGETIFIICSDYMINFPDLFLVAECFTGRLAGYVMAKIEGFGEDLHGHISALSIAPEFRRMGLSTILMQKIDETCESKKCYFIDLFVRAKNQPAIELYKKLGYIEYRRVLKYYTSENGNDDCTAVDMRKVLSTDSDKKSIVCKKRIIDASELQQKWLN